jgi:hypothetical protein
VADVRVGEQHSVDRCSVDAPFGSVAYVGQQVELLVNVRRRVDQEDATALG